MRVGWQPVDAVHVDDGPAVGEQPGGLDGDVHVPQRDHLGIHEVGDRERVVHRRRSAVLLQPLLDQTRHGGGDRSAEATPAVAVVRGDAHLRGRVERDHDQPAEPGSEHRVRGLGVPPHVALRARRDVAAGVRAAHRHDLLDRVDERGTRRECTGDVGERPGRHQRDRSGCPTQRLDQPLDGAAGWGPLGGRQRQVWLQVPGSRGRVGSGAERSGRTLQHGYVGTADQVQHTQGVVGGVLDRDVAPDARDAEQVEARVQRGEHDRDGVVGAAVAVEHNPPGHASSGSCCSR